MLSDCVYLYGELFAPEVSLLHYQEQLLSGKKVDQKKLAEFLLLAAFLSLFDQEYLAFYLEERKILFMTTKTLRVKRLAHIGELEGLEKRVYESVKDALSVKEVVRATIHHTSENPWELVCQIVTSHLMTTKRGKQEKDDQELFLHFNKILDELKTKGEQFHLLQTAITEGLESRETRPETGE